MTGSNAFLKAVIIGVKYCEYKIGYITRDTYRYIKKSKGKQEAEVRHMLNTLALSERKINEIGESVLYEKVAEYLRKMYHVSLKIYLARNLDLYFSSVCSSKDSKNVLSLAKESNNQYEIILRKTSYFRSRYFCELCERAYSSTYHRCTNLCKKCGASLAEHDHQEQQRIFSFCSACGRDFFSQTCYRLHKQALCKTSIHCECGKIIPRANINEHVCNIERQCGSCKETINPLLGPHECYIQPLTCRQSTRKDLSYCWIICFDIESTVQNDRDADLKRVKHEANLICCIIYEVTGNGPGEYKESHRCHWFGDDCINSFCTYFLSPDSSKYSNALLFSHFGGRYDLNFILGHTIRSMALYPKVIQNGAKLMTLQYPKKMRFLDSFSYIPVSLAHFAKTFDLKHIKKTTFPHLFNRKENYNYRGRIPPKMFYGYDTMNSVQKREFDSWYSLLQVSDFEFQFLPELVSYCYTDCSVLSEGILRFRDIVITATDVCPFTEGTNTLPATALRIWRTLHLIPKSLVNIPRRRRSSNIMSSMTATRFLDFLSQRDKIKIYHNANSNGEIRIGRYFVDGVSWSSADAGIKVFEVAGCRFHGCPACFPDCRDIPQMNYPISQRGGRGPILSSMNDRYAWTKRKEAALQRWGFQVYSFFTCEIEKIYAENRSSTLPPQISLYKIGLLHPEDALYGGRTEVFVRYLEASKEIRLAFQDVNSLYPYVLKTQKYPIKGYQIIRPLQDGGGDTRHRDFSTFFGIAKVKILPPRDAFVPLLPVHHKGKCIFALCRSCVEEREEVFQRFRNAADVAASSHFSFCDHEDSEDRAFTGVWTTFEIQTAITKAKYVLLAVYEVWHFESSSSEIFSQYVNLFYRLKQESTGYPENVETEEEKHRYRKMILDTDGVDLNPSDIKPNPGKRNIVKMLLNSLWGKLATKQQKVTKYLDGKADLMRYLNDDRLEIDVIEPVSDECVLLRYSWKSSVVVKESNDSDSRITDMPVHSNALQTVIASYVTSYARCYLYEHLLIPEPQFLAFCDTDSLLYGFRSPEHRIQDADHLGGFGSEISKQYGSKAIMKRALLLGAKQYAYEIADQTTGHVMSRKIKIRGFSFNAEAENEINMDQLETMLQCEHKMSSSSKTSTSKNVIPISYPNQICRNTKTKELFSTLMIKKYRIFFDKRIIVPGRYVTYPFGYKCEGGKNSQSCACIPFSLCR